MSGHGICKIPKSYRPLVEAATSAGWTLVPKRRHLVLRAPDGVTSTCVPSSPSDHRALKNLRAALRRAGVPI